VSGSQGREGENEESSNTPLDRRLKCSGARPDASKLGSSVPVGDRDRGREWASSPTRARNPLHHRRGCGKTSESRRVEQLASSMAVPERPGRLEGRLLFASHAARSQTTRARHPFAVLLPPWAGGREGSMGKGKTQGE
jgi:hypothetical protein